MRPLRLHPAEELLVPLDAQVGVEAALQQDLDAAQGHRLVDLPGQLLAGEDVGVGVAARPVEGAEVAGRGADVGVVDVARDDVGDHPVAVEGAAAGVGGQAELEERRLLVEQLGLVVVDALAGRPLGERGVERDHPAGARCASPRRPRSGAGWAAGSPSRRPGPGRPPGRAARAARGRSGCAGSGSAGTAPGRRPSARRSAGPARCARPRPCWAARVSSCTSSGETRPGRAAQSAKIMGRPVSLVHSRPRSRTWLFFTSKPRSPMTSAPLVPVASASPSSAGMGVKRGWTPMASRTSLASTCEVREAVSRKTSSQTAGDWSPARSTVCTGPSAPMAMPGTISYSPLVSAATETSARSTSPASSMAAQREGSASTSSIRSERSEPLGEGPGVEEGDGGGLELRHGGTSVAQAGTTVSARGRRAVVRGQRLPRGP